MVLQRPAINGVGLDALSTLHRNPRERFAEARAYDGAQR
jgi:hypothetical protein